MNSIILRTTGRFLVVLLAVLSVIVLLRGHNEPGGGFIGGLMMAAGIGLHALCFGVRGTRGLIRVKPIALIAWGSAALVGSGVIALLIGDAFLTGWWSAIPLPLAGKFSTILIFDIGVYMVVIGASLGMLLAVEEDAESGPSFDAEKGGDQ